MIEISHLVRKFGQLNAVDDLSLQVMPGEVLGFLGPNGAGKSTTMKILTGCLRPSSGRVLIDGIDIEKNPLAIKRQIGYLPEGAPAYEEMTVRGFLKFIAALRGYKGAAIEERLSGVVAAMSLDTVLDQRIEVLSKGFKRRVGLAQAILHDPRILILDEPTDGLDPNQKHQVRELIRGLSKDKIIIISTHILEEVTAVCTRAVIISNGKILEDCEPDTLETQSKYHGAITVTSQSAADMHRLLERAQTLENVASVLSVEHECQLTLFASDREKSLLLPVARLLDELGIVAEILQEKGRLDEVFRNITEAGGV